MLRAVCRRNRSVYFCGSPKLKSRNYLAGLDADRFSAEAAEAVNAINAGRPFPDGNGRTQRHWLRMLANNAGYDLTLTEHDREAWNEASRLGFEKGDRRPMAALIRARLSDWNPEPDRSQAEDELDQESAAKPKPELP